LPEHPRIKSKRLRLLDLDLPNCRVQRIQQHIPFPAQRAEGTISANDPFPSIHGSPIARNGSKLTFRQ
jgi:hypothetical protein